MAIECDVHVSRDQHGVGSIDPGDRDCASRRGGFDASDGDRWHGAPRDLLRGSPVAITSAKILEKLPFFRLRDTAVEERPHPIASET